MRVRLRQVAERAGVSEATVSRVVNNRPGVNEATRTRVRAALAELGYSGPALARGRAGGLIGLMMPELTNPIFPLFAQAIETLLARHGYTAVLCTATAEGVQEPDYIAMLLEHGVEGIVVVSGINADTSADQDVYRALLARQLPLVFVNGHAAELDAPFMSCDDRFAAELAVRHLASLGHTRIGCLVGPRRYLPVQRKLAGYHETMGELGLATTGLVAESLFTVEGGHAGGRALLHNGVTAVVAASDLMALGVIRAAREMGLHVPDDVSVVGYDDTLLMGFTDPPLTTVRQPVVALSDAAARALIDRLAGQPIDHNEYLFRPELIVRNSTGPAHTAASVSTARGRTTA
jgi:alanine racemase